MAENKMDIENIQNVNRMMCVQCKRWVAVRSDIFNLRVRNFGSVEKLLMNYKCRECR
jgi:hypothetical protein